MTDSSHDFLFSGTGHAGATHARLKSIMNLIS